LVDSNVDELKPLAALLDIANRVDPALLSSAAAFSLLGSESSSQKQEGDNE